MYKTQSEEKVLLYQPPSESQNRLTDNPNPSPVVSKSAFHQTLFILLNVISSVGIVMVNKYVFSIGKFHFGTALSCLHFMVTTLCLGLCSQIGWFQPKIVSWKPLIPISCSLCLFVVFTNLSLQWNSIGFYQMTKVLTTPTIAIAQAVFYKIKPGGIDIVASLVVICLGVMLASATDVSLNWLGAVYAVLGVLVASHYQISIAVTQSQLNINAMQLLFYQAPLSCLLLLPLIPLLDDMDSLLSYDYSISNVIAILVSSLLAFLVNVSTFYIIGQTSPITYNVVGHFKLCLILILGFLLFSYSLDWMNLGGILLALIGILLYTRLKLHKQHITILEKINVTK